MDKSLDSDLMRELYGVLKTDFWRYFKPLWGNEFELDINHFTRVEGYRLLIDHVSSEKLKEDIFYNLTCIWGDLKNYKFKDSTKEFNKNYDVRKEILIILLDVMGEFIKYKISNLDTKNYHRDIQSMYKKFWSEKEVVGRYKKIKKLQIEISSPLIYPPFLPSDTYHIALRRLLNLKGKGLTEKLSENILAKAFMSNGKKLRYKQTEILKEYQEISLSRRKKELDKSYEKPIADCRGDKECIEKLKKDKEEQKKSIDENDWFYPPNAFYMLDLKQEIERERLSKLCIEIPCKDALIIKMSKNMRNPQKFFLIN